MQLTSEFTKIFLFVTAAAIVSVAGAYSSGAFIDEPTLSAKIDTNIEWLTTFRNGTNSGFMWFTIYNDGDVNIHRVNVQCNGVCNNNGDYNPFGGKFVEIVTGDSYKDSYKIRFDINRGEILTVTYTLFTANNADSDRVVQQIVVT